METVLRSVLSSAVIRNAVAVLLMALITSIPVSSWARGGGGGGHSGGSRRGHTGGGHSGGHHGHSAPHTSDTHTPTVGTPHGGSHGSPTTHGATSGSKHKPTTEIANPAPGGIGHSNPSKCMSCPRDDKGRIARSQAARREFMRQTGYPHGRPGYVIDHIVPLKKGGCDCPANMQWQTVEAAKAKDRFE